MEEIPHVHKIPIKKNYLSEIRGTRFCYSRCKLIYENSNKSCLLASLAL